MAGIGFALRRLEHRDELFAPMAAIANAAVIAAGPWLYTALAIAVINEIASPLIGKNGLATFTVILVYIFSLSLVATAPVTMICTRVLADELYRRHYDDVRALFIFALLVASALTVTLAILVFVVLLDIPIEVAIIGTAGAQVVSMLWIALAFCGAIREYLQVTLSFAVGLVFGTTLSALAALYQLGPSYMVMGFVTGLLIVFVFLTARLASTFPFRCVSLRNAAALALSRLRHSPDLAIGALASAVGVWIDKWIIWTSNYGEVTDIGLVHAPLYDAPMFIASLTVVPALALFVTVLETTFFDHYRAYAHAIDNHATLRSIELQGEKLIAVTLRTLLAIVVIQAGLCMIVILATPAIVEGAGLQFQQVGILRMGTLGGLFQFIFISSSAILIFLNATTIYAALQAMFVAFICIATIIASRFDLETLAAGYMVSCVIVGTASLVPLMRVMRGLSFRNLCRKRNRQVKLYIFGVRKMRHSISFNGRIVSRLTGVVLATLLLNVPNVVRADTGTLLHVGDRLKITVFETPDVGAAGASTDKTSAFLLQAAYPRVDLSGEYAVEPDGSVAMPLFGPIAANNRTVEAFRAELGEVFTKWFQRRSSITVSFLQRAPVYIVGSVRNPGSYPFAPGLIVLQALALAGGEMISTPDQSVEAFREQERRAVAQQKYQTALINVATLAAKRDPNIAANAGNALRGLVGEAAAQDLLAKEQRVANLRTQNLSNERQALEKAISTAADEIDLLKQRIKSFDAQIEARGERLRTMETLFSRQVVVSDRVADIRRDYTDMEGNRMDAQVRLLQVGQRLDSAKNALMQANAKEALNTERELATASAEREEAERTFMMLSTTAMLLARGGAAYTGTDRVTSVFEVVRRDGDTLNVLHPSETDALEPGDVLRVRVATTEKTSSVKRAAK